MSMWQYAVEEFKRSPVTVVATVIGVVFAALGLFIAALPYMGQTPAPLPNVVPIDGRPTRLNLANLALCVAFFFALNFSVASLVRMLARVHWFAATVISVPAAVFSGFFSMVVCYLSPPKSFDEPAWNGLVEVVLYGTVFIYVAVHGLPVLRDFAAPKHPAKASLTEAEHQDAISPPQKAAPKNDGSDGVFALVAFGILLTIWCNMTSAGLKQMVKLFLS
jgi:hypothetical protein